MTGEGYTFRDLEPMGDPSAFSIEDLTPEEDAFFAVIEDL